LHSRLPILISFQDLDGRTFSHKQELFVADNSGFASTYWGGYASPAGTTRGSAA